MYGYLLVLVGLPCIIAFYICRSISNRMNPPWPEALDEDNPDEEEDIESAAYVAGYDAQCKLGTKAHNPYPIGSKDNDDWEAGNFDAFEIQEYEE